MATLLELGPQLCIVSKSLSCKKVVLYTRCIIKARKTSKIVGVLMFGLAIAMLDQHALM